MSRRPITTHPVDGYQGKGAKNSLRNIPHYCLPGLNTYSMSNIRNSEEAIQYYSAPDHFNLPVPCVAFSEIESKTNIVMDMVNVKIQWKHENEKLLKLCRNKLSLHTLESMRSALHKTETSCLKIPFVLTCLTSNLMKNPDEYFNSEYNWYFKNTIEKFKFNAKWYLACARGVNLDTLDIISMSNNTFESIETKKDMFFKGTIFDIKSSNSNELMVRQKTKLFVFWNNINTDILLDTNSLYDNCGIPLADADIATNTFCTADVKHVIKLWKDGNCIQDQYFEVLYNQNDSFMHLNYLHNQTDLIAIINRQKFYLIDTRIDISKPCLAYDPCGIIEPCEELTALKNSHLNTHSFYVASNHSVLTLDNRMGYVHKSYHMLSNPPSLITTHCYENSFEPNEMLFLGNQTGESLINLSYSSLEDDLLSCRNMSSAIPKPLDALHNVRLQGHCLNPILLDRFSRCLTGTTAFGEHNEDLRLFSINNAGDLFVQKINDNKPIDAIEFKKLISVKSKIVPKLNYTKIFDMSKLWRLEPPHNQEEVVKTNSIWSISKEKMISYVDHLAPLILSPWDIDDLSEWDYENKFADADADDSDCDYATKVHLWFNKNDSLLGLAEPSEPITSNLPINCLSQNITSKASPTSENDEDSSSGFTVSIKSDED